MTPAALERREADWERLTRESFDLLVVGGGITGAGTLLDAASRGLKAALVERDDLAVGSSSRSSKLIHGGLRYLEQLRFGLVGEALAERRRLLRLAPHLVRLERFVAPIHGSALQLPYVGAGMVLYDLLGAARDGGRFHALLPGSVRRLAPAVRSKKLRGGFVYHDGIVDDSRLVSAVVRTAEDLGGLALTRVEAVELNRDAGRATGLRVRDRLTGNDADVRAAAIVDATGVTAGPAGPFAADGAAVDWGEGAASRPSRGIHFVVRGDRLPVATGVTIRVPGRVVFVIPWHEHVIVGTTDEPHTGPTDRPAATSAEIDYLLEHVNAVMDVGLTRADLIATYAGVRPLVGGDADTVKASREHRVGRPLPGLVTVRGGKYTTYRVMARDAVDAALGSVARRRPSLTASQPIRGAVPSAESATIGAEIAEQHGLDGSLARRLAGRHGSDAPAVASLGAELDLLRPLVEGTSYLEAEVAWAAREEHALGLDDVLARRTRLVLESPDQGRGAAARTAEILASELGWDETRQAHEVAAYAASSEREYGTSGR
ncbi:MAG: glycerol-3-phosphate dehydrogenase/oxidase [Chloroflexi bacterium]|nr:glycerol-3-phosphate dehydrogenase/oxidase [Chloroflexota bacterium]